MADELDEPVMIDVWSDIACPWCYVGKRRLDKAIAASGVKTEVRYHAFELDRQAKGADGRTEVDALALKIGSREHASELLAEMTELAAEEGLVYDFDTVVPTNTLAAHRLLAHALRTGGAPVQVALAEILFKAHFTDGKNVGDVAVLAAAAEQVGLDPAAAIAALDDESTLTSVRRDQLQADELSVRAVPFYVIDSQYGINGAQSVHVFSASLQRVVEERAALYE